MTIQEILAKLLKGETLTDEEKTFAEAFNLQKELDTVSASARRKAEKEAKDAKDALDALKAEMDGLKAKGKNPSQNEEIAALQKQVAKLTALNDANEAKLKAQARTEAIRKAAKENGISVADGVSAAMFDRLLDLAVGETDVNDGEALKGALLAFKNDNPAMIAANVKGGIETKGLPGGSVYTGKNPFKADSQNLTEQMRLLNEHPEQAKALAAEAGVTL